MVYDFNTPSAKLFTPEEKSYYRIEILKNGVWYPMIECTEVRKIVEFDDFTEAFTYLGNMRAAEKSKLTYDNSKASDHRIVKKTVIEKSIVYTRF